jgi:hypothetical protein
MLMVASAACAITQKRLTLDPAIMAELWEPPADLERRDLFFGAGGPEHQPDARAVYKLRSVKSTGMSPGFEVTDERGRDWSVKLGVEARTEIVVSRLVWAIGYRQPPTYYVPTWTLSRDGHHSTQAAARFRPDLPDQVKDGGWSWRENPFRDTRPMAGLFVFMVMVNNWDLKTEQNVVYNVKSDAPGPRRWYTVRDLGASFGRTAWLFAGTKDDPVAFEQEPFIESVEGNRVRFHFQGAWREPHLIDSATPADVRWTCELLARLSEKQWQDAFRAGGFDDAESARYIRRMREKIAEGLAVDAP